MVKQNNKFSNESRSFLRKKGRGMVVKKAWFYWPQKSQDVYIKTNYKEQK